MVDFSPGLNVLRGSNNSGKSTVLRAVQFLALREQAARDRIITTGERDAAVGLAFSGDDLPVLAGDMGDGLGFSIWRGIGSKTNEVALAPAQTYSSPTRDTIALIQKQLEPFGLAPVTLPGGGTWWPQFRSVGDMFLVSSTPVEAKRLLSGLSYTDVYERARDIARGVRDELKAEVTASQKLLDKTKEDLDVATNKAESLRPLCDQANDLADRAQELRDTGRELLGCIGQLGQVEGRLLQLPTIQVAEDHATWLGQWLSACQEAGRMSEAISTKAAELECVESQLATRDEIEETLVLLRAANGSRMMITDQSKKLGGSLSALEATEERLKNAKQAAEAAEDELQEVRSEVLANGTCPILDGLCPRAESASGGNAPQE